MLATTVALIFSICLFLSNVNAETQSSACDVVIIGGGSAGANTAVFVKDKYPAARVCVFERFGNLGGHCNTRYFVPPVNCSQYFIPPLSSDALCPNWVEVGVQLIDNSTWLASNGKGTWTLPGGTDGYMARFLPYGKSSLIPANVFNSSAYAAFTVDFALNPTAIPSSQPNNTLVSAAVTRWVNTFSTLYPWLDDAGNYSNPIPKELLVDFSTYLSYPNNSWMAPLVFPIFYPLIGFGGMGNWSKLTTFYALLNLHPGIIQWYFQPNPGALAIAGGCSALYDGITSYLLSKNVSIFFNSNITKVVTTAGTYANPIYTLAVSINGSASQSFTSSKIFFAIPPTQANFEAIGFSVISASTNNPQTFFSENVQTREFFGLLSDLTGGITANPLYAVVNFNYLALGNNTYPGNPYPATPALLRLGRDIPYGPAVGTAASDSNITTGAMTTTLLGQFGALTAANSGLFSDIPLTELIHHTYQPYYSVSALNKTTSPYVTAASFQGQRGLFFVGALHSFAESAKIWEQAYRIVSTKLILPSSQGAF